MADFIYDQQATPITAIGQELSDPTWPTLSRYSGNFTLGLGSPFEVPSKSMFFPKLDAD